MFPLTKLAETWGREIARYGRWAVGSGKITFEGEIPSGPFIAVTWHSMNLLALAVIAERRPHPYRAFVPPGLAGATMRGWLIASGMTPVPLPSDGTGNPIAGLREMGRTLAADWNIAIALDGPHGPPRAQRPWGAVRAIKCNRNVPVCRERPPHLPKSRDGVACAVRGKRHGRHAARDEPAPHGRTRKTRRYKGAVRMGSPFGNNSQGKQVHTVPRHSDEWSRWNLSLKGDLPRAHCPTPVAGDLAAPGLGELGKWKHLSLSIPIAAVLSGSTAGPNPIGRVVLHVYPTTVQHVYPTTLESAEPP